MRHLASAALFALLAATPIAAQAQAGAMLVAPSGRATAEVVLTFADSAARAAATPARIRLDYGQPHLRGRQLLTDSLVPYDRPWRTGANDATTLRTDVDLTIGGSAIAKGTYVLTSLPTRTGWSLVISREPTPSATGGAPVAGAEVARVALRQSAMAAPVESFTMWLIPTRAAGAPRGELRMAWGTVALATDWSMR